MCPQGMAGRFSPCELAPPACLLCCRCWCPPHTIRGTSSPLQLWDLGLAKQLVPIVVPGSGRASGRKHTSTVEARYYRTHILSERQDRDADPFLRTLKEARLQAVLSRNMYSLHGLLALMRPALGQVCQALMVLSNWTPGSAQRQAA